MSKSKTGMTLIILLLVVLLVLFAVGFGFLYKAMNKTNNPTPDTNITVQQTVPIEDITVFSLGETIITNLLPGPDQQKHVIKISINLGVNTSKETAKEAEKLLATLEAQKTIIKDIVIDICTNKTYEEMEMTNAKNLVKEEILATLQETFATNLIVDVYIDDFLTQ